MSTTTLADVVGDVDLYDAPTGRRVEDADGVADRAADYVVVRTLPTGGYAVRGPSGQVDHTDPADHTRLYRDAE